MKRIFGNIGKIIWAPLIFTVMQLIASFGYMIAVAVWTGIRVGFESAFSGGDVADIDSDRLEEMIVESLNMHIPMFISAAMTFAIIFAIMYKEWKIESFWSLGKIKADSNYIILIICAGLGISANLFMSGFMAFLPVPDREQPFEILLGDNLLLMLFTLALVAPVIEEIVFRGIVQKKLMKMMRVPGAVILQAVIFGIVHMDIYQGMYTIIIGLVIGIVYLWYDSIYVPIVIHVAFNATSVILYRIAGGAEINAGVFMIITGAALFISMGFILTLASKRPKPVYGYNGYNGYNNYDRSNNNDDDDTPPFVG